MIEPILKALVQLFALITDIHDIREISSKEKDIVRLFLSRQLNNEFVKRYMEMFDEFLVKYHSENIVRGSIKDKKRTSLTAVRILGICEKINAELDQKQKLYVMVQLIDFISFGTEATDNELDFLETVSTAFNIPYTEFLNIKNFILNSVKDVPEKNRVMIIDKKSECEPEGVKHLYKDNIRGTISLLHVVSTNSYILRYSGNDDLFLNGQNILPDQTYTFNHGSTIRGSGIKTIYYNDVTTVFTEETFKVKISLDATDVCLRFRNSENGIQKFNFHEESGNLVGILGGSGVGKTTLLNVLSGITEPQSGEVLINGLDLYSEKEKIHLKGIIGFVPQDDLLIEELTVYQNLYYSAKMCLDNLSEYALNEVVNKTLTDLDLDEIRNLKVGNSLNKVISGGQRKRLNIALELIREPTILFVDEPTSGLSSVDSEIVMTLLKELTYKGKLVIINIHQPGSDIYKMFDKIMIIDKGGYQIFYGNPSEAIVYFKTKASYANSEEDQCIACGNINSDQLLQIIEAKVVNESGKHTAIRKVTPQEWAEKFHGSKEKSGQKIIGENSALPENFYSTPGLIKQTRIFFIRDVLSKLSNKQNMVIIFIVSPLLAFLMAYFTKYAAGGKYTFSGNENLPAYLFMCVITSLFMGLIVSAEEIVKDRKILKRESFLNLSWFSYLNSKVLIMFIISAIQTISFILVGNFILEIRGMTFSYWFIIFTTSCLANLIGLNISSAFNSIIAIYSLIPCIIIPQLLFSGVFVNFDRLHQGRLTSSEFVPVIGEIMPARWSYEALAVEQFKNNRYERNFFKYKMSESQNSWYSDFLIEGALKEDLWRCRKAEKGSIELRDSYCRLNYHINYLSGLTQIEIPEGLKSALNIKNIDSESAKLASDFLDLLKKRFIGIIKHSKAQEDSVSKSIETKIGEQELIIIKSNNWNKSLEDVVLGLDRKPEFFEKTDRRIIQKYKPCYMEPLSNYGRAQFYSPYKKVGNLRIDTFWFNTLVLWMITTISYIVLYFNFLQKIVTSFENLRFTKEVKQL